mmetsp:Transcript_49008/g.119447  ORF Transcript_49008/g.119447 Transcript_49008/m.119447 type:complete len:547 (+) Transcript_49008:370-2010(+)
MLIPRIQIRERHVHTPHEVVLGDVVLVIQREGEGSRSTLNHHDKLLIPDRIQRLAYNRRAQRAALVDLALAFRVCHENYAVRVNGSQQVHRGEILRLHNHHFDATLYHRVAVLVALHRPKVLLDIVRELVLLLAEVEHAGHHAVQHLLHLDKLTHNRLLRPKHAHLALHVVDPHHLDTVAPNLVLVKALLASVAVDEILHKLRRLLIEVVHFLVLAAVLPIHKCAVPGLVLGTLLLLLLRHGLGRIMKHMREPPHPLAIHVHTPREDDGLLVIDGRQNSPAHGRGRGQPCFVRFEHLLHALIRHEGVLWLDEPPERVHGEVVNLIRHTLDLVMKCLLHSEERVHKDRQKDVKQHKVAHNHEAPEVQMEDPLRRRVRHLIVKDRLIHREDHPDEQQHALRDVRHRVHLVPEAERPADRIAHKHDEKHASEVEQVRQRCRDGARDHAHARLEVKCLQHSHHKEHNADPSYGCVVREIPRTVLHCLNKLQKLVLLRRIGGEVARRGRRVCKHGIALQDVEILRFCMVREPEYPACGHESKVKPIEPVAV